MKIIIEKLILIGATIGSGAAMAHAGDHAGPGVMALVAHFLGEHGYLAIVGLLVAFGVAHAVRSRHL